ncbi:hypothetical protein Q3H58_003932 [Pseudomonas psychrotolerans]|nr:hypothetical protein [Pseudomonas psychrotolerans]
MTDLGVPGRQAQGVGGDFQLAFQVVAVGGLEDGLQLGLLGGEGVEIGIRLGVGGIDFVQARLGLLDLTRRLLRLRHEPSARGQVSAPAADNPH